MNYDPKLGIHGILSAQDYEEITGEAMTMTNKI